MQEIWDLEALARNHPVVMARTVPFGTGLAPNHPFSFPAYVKCIELDLPI